MGVRSLGQEDSLEQEMATNSCILAWRIPWTEERQMTLPGFPGDTERERTIFYIVASVLGTLLFIIII